MQPTRRDFVAMAAALGLTAAVSACSRGGSDRNAAGTTSNDASVLIMGAGAAGMAAGYLLAQRGIEFRIVEAAPRHGGRMKHHLGFVDFPIPLGAEWLHASAATLTRAVNDAAVDIDIVLAGYQRSDTNALATDDGLTIDTVGFYDDLKFVGSSWLDFFDRFIFPSVEARATFDTHVVAIADDGSTITATTSSGGELFADHVVVTVPMKILQDGDIAFDPPLPPIMSMR